MPRTALASAPARRAGPFRLREVVYPADMRMAPHSHDHPSVTLVLAGGLRESVGHHEDEATPLSVVIKPPEVRHADTFGPRGARTLQIAWHADTELGEATAALRLGWSWLHLSRGVPEFLTLAGELRACGGTSERLESLTWDVLAALAVGDGDDAERCARPAPRAAPRWIRRVREELDDRIDEGPEVRELADAAGVHPGSLTRAFRRHYGESVTSYRTRQRLRRAVRALSLPGGSPSRVAQDAGFADHPHLCRCVRDATGFTPSQLRRTLVGRT